MTKRNGRANKRNGRANKQSHCHENMVKLCIGARCVAQACQLANIPC